MATLKRPAAPPRLFVRLVAVTPSPHHHLRAHDVIGYRDPAGRRVHIRWSWWSPHRPRPGADHIVLGRITWRLVWLDPDQRRP